METKSAGAPQSGLSGWPPYWNWLCERGPLRQPVRLTRERVSSTFGRRRGASCQRRRPRCQEEGHLVTSTPSSRMVKSSIVHQVAAAAAARCDLWMMMTMVLKMLRKSGQSSHFRSAHTVCPGRCLASACGSASPVSVGTRRYPSRAVRTRPDVATDSRFCGYGACACVFVCASGRPRPKNMENWWPKWLLFVLGCLPPRPAVTVLQTRSKCGYNYSLFWISQLHLTG